MREIILKYVLENAVRYDGKANDKAIIGHILQEKPELKNKIRELQKDISKVVNEINKLKIEEQRKKLEEIAPELLEERKEKKELKELPDAKIGKVVTRMPPEPSKYTHIGHALSFLINYLYAKKYKGKCILRFEDTNPEKCKREYVKAIEDDVLVFLGIKPSKVVYVSDDINRLYNYAEKLIRKGEAYVCFCKREKMQELRHKGEQCKCRCKIIRENLDNWKDMLKGNYKEGECSLRLKGDMKADNHVMRDPVIFRLNYKKHFRQGRNYKAWPMFDFYNALEDNFCKVTHVMRSIEFGEMRIELQNYIRRLFNLKNPVVIQYGRFNIAGKISKGREIRKLIEEKKIEEWDDPRLTTLKALRRRGFVKETFYELAKEVGLSVTETNIDANILAAINTKFIDKIADRYFFVENPKKVRIKDAPEIRVELDLYPMLRKGGRKFLTKDEFYISEKLERGKNYRLMNLFNFRDKKFLSKEIDSRLDVKLIHWLPVSKNLVKIDVLMDDGKIVNGVGEESLRKVKEGEIVQFVRYGFCKLEKKEKNKFGFIFTHK